MQFQYLKTTPQSDLVQNMLILASLGTNWYENERFGLFFTKTLVFMPKSGSINSGTGLLVNFANFHTPGSGSALRYGSGSRTAKWMWIHANCGSGSKTLNFGQSNSNQQFWSFPPSDFALSFIKKTLGSKPRNTKNMVYSSGRNDAEILVLSFSVAGKTKIRLHELNVTVLGGLFQLETCSMTNWISVRYVPYYMYCTM